MVINLFEARMIFQKWQSERSVLLCLLSFRASAASLYGRVIELTENETEIVSDDGRSMLKVRLLPGMGFAFRDAAEASGEGESYENGLFIAFPSVRPEDEPDTINILDVSSPVPPDPARPE